MIREAADKHHDFCVSANWVKKVTCSETNPYEMQESLWSVPSCGNLFLCQLVQKGKQIKRNDF